MYRAVAPALLLALSAVSFSEDRNLSTLRKSLDAARKKYNVQGMSIAVVKDGKIVYQDGFGYRDTAKKLPATPTTAYAIGSSTKAFTALLTAQAAADGKLALTDPPSKYLPNFKLKDPETNAKITLSDMMSHRSGLPRTDLAWYSNGFTREELMQIVAGVEPTAKLGAKFQYQNLMFLFTGMIDEKVYGKPYETLLQDRYFTPLGMSRSSATYSAFLATPERAVGYLPGGDLPLPVHNIDVCAPAGSINSTVIDMSKYLTMLLADGQYEGKTLFSKDAIAETRKFRMSMAPGTPLGYGYGWMLRPFESRTLVEHGGNIDGFNAEVALLPGDHLGAVVLTNVSSSPLALEAAQMALKKFLPAAPAPVPVPAPNAAATKATAPAKAAIKVTAADEAPESRLGDYRLEIAKIDLRFYREGAKTFFEQDGQKFPLTLIGPGKYKALGIPGDPTFTFVADPADAKKTIATLEQGGAKLRLTGAEPFQAPLSAEELLAKSIEAKGGADTLRQHQTRVLRYRARMQSDGVDVFGIRYERPSQAANFEVLFGLGKRFGDELSFCDGTYAGNYASFAQGGTKSGASAADEILAANELADAEPALWYKSTKIVREDKVGGEAVYVLKKLPKVGSPITDYISKATFRVLREDHGPAQQEYSDFRSIDGLTMPFRSVTTVGESGKTVIEIVSVTYTEPVPDWPFKAPTKSK